MGGEITSAYAPNPIVWIDPLGLTGTGPRTHVTYRGIDAATGKPYAGYASMPGQGKTFQEVVNYRYNSDFSRFQGGQMPDEVYTGSSKPIARGLEQRTFENDGGLKGTANKQNPVGAGNRNRTTYLDAADEHRKNNRANTTGGCKF